MDIPNLLKRSKDEDSEKIDRALRPQSFDAFVGNKELTDKLSIAIKASNERDEPLDHILLTGPPGLGKTTVAKIIAKETDGNYYQTAAPSIKKLSDLLTIITKLKPRDTLFIDEVHRLDIKIEEVLYGAMEDNAVDIQLGNKQIATVPIKPFCMIGATTSPGLMSAPFRDRFGIQYNMKYYTDEELANIVAANAKKLNLKIQDPESVLNVAKRSRGTPRVANRLLRRVRDYVQINNNNTINTKCVDESLKIEGVNNLGLTPIDDKYLLTLHDTFGTGPAGLQVMASTIDEDQSTLTDFIEPYLMRIGFISRQARGRVLTQEGMQYVNESCRQ